MRIAICDDNLDYIKTFEKYLSDIETPNLEYEIFHGGEELLRVYESGRADYDALFLDMEMDGLSGIDAANKIRETDRHVIIVFVTNHTKYMRESFRCAPFRFLVKPLTKDELNETLRAVFQKISEEKTTFVFTENRNRIRIYSEDIIFFESFSHWLIIHDKNGNEYKIRKTIKELTEKIDKNVFCRVHRAFVVNLGYIHKITETNIILNCYANPIPLSRTYKKVLADAFLNFRERKYLL